MTGSNGKAGAIFHAYRRYGRKHMTTDILAQNRESWNAMADAWFGTTALPTYGCLAPTEEELGLFPPLGGKRVLDLGCGSGHSLAWCGGRGAAELWGLDLSSRQLENAEGFLTSNGYAPRLFCSPMEENPGLPAGYFDVVYSIYALGWTTDLGATLRNVASCLRPGGVFIFSWDHPFMHCVTAEEGRLWVEGSYLADEVFSFPLRGRPVTLTNRRLSTYVNALAEAGLFVDRLVEETDGETASRQAEFSSGYYTSFRAKKLPLSMVVRAKKPTRGGDGENV